MNVGNLHLLADGKTGAKRISNSAKKVDEPTADTAEKAEDLDTGINQAKAQQTKLKRRKTQTQARTRQRHSRRRSENEKPRHRQKKQTKPSIGTTDAAKEARRQQQKYGFQLS